MRSVALNQSSQINSHESETEELAIAIRDACMAGYFLVPWDDLRECDRAKWLEAAHAGRRVIDGQNGRRSPRSARTVALRKAG